MVLKRIFIAGILVFLTLTPVLGAQDEESMVEWLTLPAGDLEGGRQAFQDLKCNACHAIAADADMAGPVASMPGPTLGVKQSFYKTGFVTESIIFPAHAVPRASGAQAQEPLESRMGDFSDVMTVRQLVDLIAYLKSLDEDV